MLEVYKVSPLLKQTIQIECITSYADNLLLGTRQGHLLTYNIVKTSEDKPDVQLMRYNKMFSKKPILQLEAIPEHNILICLTDNLIQVHDMKMFNLPIINTLHRTKGATLFIVDVVKGNTINSYNLCVVVKRKLQLYFWNGTEFLKFHEDIHLVEVPKAIGWCEGTIFVGYRGEYCCYELNGKKSRDLFPTSGNRSTDPYIFKYSETTFALVREEKSVLVNDQGEADIHKLIKWSEIPTALAWDEPYCVALLGDKVEVQTFENTDGFIQTIPDLTKVRFISRAQQGLIYIASISQVWIMQALEIPLQRKILLEKKQFQLALKLTTVSNESKEDKDKMVNDIQTLFAYDLFAQKRFKESLHQFLQLKTNPSHVIRLFPNLVPQQSGLPENDSHASFTEREWEDGIQALIEYLTDIRLRHQVDEQKKKKDMSKDEQRQQNINLSEGSDNSSQQLLQIIDTTLLKCYVHTNDAMVASLLRSNNCHFAETEKTLKKFEKHNELIILYETKGQHRKALELLQGNVERTISHLQKIGPKHMGLILEFADWVLKAAPTEGLKIFTGDMDLNDITEKIKKLPRPRILDYLLRSHETLVIQYLEHVIEIWKDTNPIFHNALIHKYREKSLSDDPAAAVTRKKLNQFLETSTNYKPETVIANFPTDTLLAERAIILGKLGQHEHVLAIYVRAMGDIEKAVEYCKKVYDKQQNGAQTVFVTLIKLILNPESCELLPGVILSPKTAQPDLESALKLLEDYASCINPSVLSLFKDTLPVSRICRFLQTALHESLKERRRVQLLKGLLNVEYLHFSEMKLHLESQSVLITDMNICPVCKKRFGNQSALVRYPNGDVVHYSCQDKKL